MSNKFISPGVFTQEIDQSFLEQGVSGIGGVIIGRSQKGPAMVPIRLSNFDEFYTKFGSFDVNMQAPYAARNYLKNNSVLNFVRVLGSDDGNSSVSPGYTVGGMVGITDDTGSSAQVLAVLHTGSTAGVTVVGVSGDSDRFVVTIGSFAVTASFLTSSADYVEKVLNTDPTRYTTDGHYLYQVFKYATPAASASWSAVMISSSLTSFAKNFTSGSTPWVKSQELGGKEFDLFRFHTLGHGRATNDELKITVMNIRPSINTKATQYGTFDVIVRSFYDTDLRKETLETFAGLTLDPDDKNYIARRIGTKYETFDSNERKFVAIGDFKSKSSYIRVEMKDNSGAPPEALPFGHYGYRKMKFAVADLNGNGTAHTVPVLTYQPNQYDDNSVFNENICWGVQFVSGGIADAMRALPFMSDAEYSGCSQEDTAFSLKYITGSYVSGKYRYTYDSTIAQSNYYSPIYVSASLHKFTMPLAGGFDGFDLRTKDPLYLTNDAAETTVGVSSLKMAVDTVADPDFIDMNLLAIPGVHALKVADHARNVVNERGDALYVMDVTGATKTEASELLKNREIDDNYTAAYYPDLKMYDSINNRIVRIAPSVAVMGAIAYSDRIGQQWFAPAGLNRAGLNQFDVEDVVDRLTYKDRNELYDNRINPIASFPNQGLVVWGQKTLQVAASALDRINVRRLLIYAKKTIASAAAYLVFEPNNPATYGRFVKMVNPILERIRQDQGIERFLVVMDSNINTPDVVDRNVMIGKILLQPIKAAEFLDLQFVITNAGVQFAA